MKVFKVISFFIYLLQGLNVFGAQMCVLNRRPRALSCHSYWAFFLFCFAAQMRYLEKGKSSLFLNVPQAISALRATGNSPDSLLWLLHPVLYTDLQHSDPLHISLAGHYGVKLTNSFVLRFTHEAIVCCNFF